MFIHRCLSQSLWRDELGREGGWERKSRNGGSDEEAVTFVRSMEMGTWEWAGNEFADIDNWNLFSPQYFTVFSNHQEDHFHKLKIVVGNRISNCSSKDWNRNRVLPTTLFAGNRKCLVIRSFTPQVSSTVTLSSFGLIEIDRSNFFK